VRLGIQFPGSSPAAVALGPAIGAAATSAVLGWATLALVEKTASRPRRAWVAVAVAGLLVSLGLPVPFATAASAALGLAAVHAAVAAAAITGLARTATARRGQASSASEPALCPSGGLGAPGPRGPSNLARPLRSSPANHPTTPTRSLS
jgi:heme A synthase